MIPADTFRRVGPRPEPYHEEIFDKIYAESLAKSNT